VLSSNYLPNHLEIACLTTHRFSSTFPFEEKGPLKILYLKAPSHDYDCSGRLQ
jgi:hypothetical protein